MDSWIHNGAFYVPQPGLWQLGDGIVWRAEFGALPVSTTTNGSANTSAIAAMPLVFARASSATAQTSESSLVISGVATDVPAIGDVGTGVGLLHEPANTNDILHSSDVSQSAWIKGTGVTATADTSDVTDPAGGNAASKVVYDGSGVANATRFAQSATIAVGEVVSLWARVASGTADIRVGTNVEYGTAATLTTAWQRISFEATAAATGIYVYGATGNNSAFTIYVYGAQHDSRRFASSTTLTTTTSVTRAMTRLHKASEAALQTTNGTYNSIRLEFRFTALEAVAAMTADRFLFYTANGDYMYIAATTHEVAVRINGVSFVSSAAIAFAKGDVVQVWVETGANTTTVIKYRVNGGTVVNLTSASPTTSSPNFTTNAIDFFAATGGGNANLLAAVVHYIRAYGYGKRPSWAR